MLNVYISLDFHGDATDHKDNLISMLGYILIHPTLKVGKAALDSIVTHTTRADFIGDKDESGVLLGEVVKLSFESGENS